MSVIHVPRCLSFPVDDIKLKSYLKKFSKEYKLLKGFGKGKDAASFEDVFGSLNRKVRFVYCQLKKQDLCQWIENLETPKGKVSLKTRIWNQITKELEGEIEEEIEEIFDSEEEEVKKKEEPENNEEEIMDPKEIEELLFGLPRAPENNKKTPEKKTEKKKKEKKKSAVVNEVPKVIMFYERGQPYYELTNFYKRAPIIINGVSWPSSEHLFQSMKASISL
jgi:hypothetical protein